MRPHVLVAMLALVVLAGCGGSSGGAQPTSPASSSSGSGATPPVVSESFTRLPCRPATTLGQEGCAGRAVVRADALINRRVARLWRRDGAAARRHLAAAQRAWLAYRRAACVSEADAFAGGTLAPVEAGQCLARISRARARELADQLSLSP